MLLYSVLLVIYIGLSFFCPNPKSKTKRFIYTVLLLLPALFLVAFRSVKVGADTYPYCYTYERISSSGSILEALEGSYMEIGYNFLEFIFGFLGFSYYAFQSLIALFYLISFSIFFFKYSSNVALSCFLLLTMQGLFGMMNQTRMWLAISILLFSFSHLVNRKFLPFLLTLALASLIHTSALVFILVYPLSYIYSKNKNATTFFLLVLGAIIALFGQSFFSLLFSIIGRYSSYSDAENYGINLASLMFLTEYFVIFIFVIHRSKKLSLLQCGSVTILRRFKLTKNAFEVIALLALVVSLAGISNTFITRVVGFFGVYLYVAYANCMATYSIKNKITLPLIATTILLTAQMYAILIFRPNWDGVVPYEFFF